MKIKYGIKPGPKPGDFIVVNEEGLELDPHLCKYYYKLHHFENNKIFVYYGPKDHYSQLCLNSRNPNHKECVRVATQEEINSLIFVNK